MVSTRYMVFTGRVVETVMVMLAAVVVGAKKGQLKRLKKKSVRNIHVVQQNISDNSNMSQGNPRARARKAKGRLTKRKAKKTIRITGLDLLHNQTLLSTSPQGKRTCGVRW